jgi:hypothetical protein
MSDPDNPFDSPAQETDERSIAKKYGLRELIYPDSEQIRSISAFLQSSVQTGKCGPIPRTAVVVLLEFLQATINRQHITKGPRMSQDEFDVLQAPYYLAARIVAKIQRTRNEGAKGQLYQATYVSLNQFLELLRNLTDPSCFWLRLKTVPDGVRETMTALNEFLAMYTEQRRKTRAS